MPNLFNQFKSLPKEYWILNSIQALERLAWWIMLLQTSIYIAQKDVVGGLHWEQGTKGVIFFFWAISQFGTQILSGGYADKYGRKPFMVYSVVILVIAYTLLATQRDYYGVLLAIILHGIGSGMFRPALQGAVSQHINHNNSSLAWGSLFWTYNFIMFAAGTWLSKYLKEIAWEWVFWGSASIMLFTLPLIAFYKENLEKVKLDFKSEPINLKQVLNGITRPKILYFLLLISGFTFLYMQFYETLPHFISDWVNSSSLVNEFNMGESFTSDNVYGKVLSYEWFLNLNTLLTLTFIIVLSWIASRFKKINVLLIGISITTVGMVLTFTSTQVYMLSLGIIIYTFGEMITNPKILDVLSTITDTKNKSLIMGYLGLSFGISYSTGALMGGYLYGKYAEKATLAMDYLKTNFSPQLEGITPQNAYAKLLDLTDTSAQELDEILWSTYTPEYFWLPFAIVGTVSVIGLIVYKKKYITT